jgi:putative DNA primase/helicase
MKGNIWAQVLARLEVSITKHDFVQWLKPTSLAADDGKTLEIRVPDEHIASWNTRHYMTAIDEALTACGRQGAQVAFVVGPPVAADLAKPTRGKVPQGKALAFETLDPWEERVPGSALLDGLATAFERFVTLPEHAATALALWAVYTYTHEAAFFSPILAIISPMKGCGKTSVIKVLGSLVHRRQIASNLTASVLFRLIDRQAPTLLIDEADTFLPENEALRGILNSGHTRTTACLIRTVGDDYEPRVFTTWCPKAIAMIGRLPSTLEDRSIQLRMRRQMRGEQRYRKERLREEYLDGLHLALRRQATRWAEDNLDALRQLDPDAPSTLTDRAADNWRPLLAIADCCGGEWPARARAAAEGLSGEAFFSDEQEPGVELLRDVAGLLAAAADPPDAAVVIPRMPTASSPRTR